MKKKANEMNVVERVKAPTPPFWKRLGKIGQILTVAGGFIGRIPKIKPIGLIVTVVGGLLSSVSELAVDDEKVKE